MGEIKSAIELAMERTSGLIMDEKERKSFRKRDVEHRVHSVIRRYLEGIIGDAKVAEEFETIDAGEEEKRGMLPGILIEEFDLISGRREKVSTLFHVIAGVLGRQPLAVELEAMEKDFSEELTIREKETVGRVLESLQKLGLTGDGLVPNVSAWKEWTEVVSETGRRFRSRLLTWKEKASQTIIQSS